MALSHQGFQRCQSPSVEVTLFSHAPALRSPQDRPVLLHNLARDRLNLRPLQTVPVAGFDELVEERVGLERLRFELWVELAAEEVGMVGDLDDLNVSLVGRCAGDAQAGAGKQRFVFAGPAAAARRNAGSGNQLLLSVAVVWTRS